MAQWVEQFRDHATHQQLRDLGNLMSDIESGDQEPSPDVTESLERLKQVRTHTTKVLSTLDPNLVPVGVLNSLSSYLQQAISYLGQFQADQNIVHLTNAND